MLIWKSLVQTGMIKSEMLLHKFWNKENKVSKNEFSFALYKAKNYLTPKITFKKLMVECQKT